MYELRCRDVGFDCSGVVRGATVEAVLKQAASHAGEVHGTQVTPELAEAVRKLIREQRSEPGAA